MKSFQIKLKVRKKFHKKLVLQSINNLFKNIIYIISHNEELILDLYILPDHIIFRPIKL